MVRSRLDSDDLPGDLEDILEGDDEALRPSFNDSDEFDPAALLSQPLFNDIDDDLNTDDLSEPVPVSEASSASSGSQFQKQQQQQQQQTNAFQHQQGYFQQQQQQQQQRSQPGSPSFSGVPQHMSQNRGATSPLNQMSNFNTNTPLETNLNQQNVNFRVQEVQSRIQKVQEQIQRVQQESNATMIGQSSNSMMGQQPQQNFQVSGMMNPTGGSGGGMGSSRSPPGRSVSMPIKRNNLQGNPMNQPTFMMQQPMQNMQTLQQQQAMMGTSMDGSVNSAMSNVNNSMTSNMNAINNSFSNMNMQNFGQQGMENGSVPVSAGFNSNMPMMQQSMQQNMAMNQLTPTPFADGGPASRQNSLPQAAPSNMNMMGGQTPSGMISGGSFDPSHMQQAFQSTQAQGMLPTSSSGQGGKPGVNEAMEKLCETMRRSAMSRSMVKQLSGRSLTRSSSGRGLTKQTSNRSLSRQNSGRLVKQMSGRNLARASSGRSIGRANSGLALQRSASGRQILMDGSEIPIRRVAQDTKHRIQRDVVATSQGPPGRGVFRHKSQSAIQGATKTILNIDGNSVGMF